MPEHCNGLCRRIENHPIFQSNSRNLVGKSVGAVVCLPSSAASPTGPSKLNVSYGLLSGIWLPWLTLTHSNSRPTASPTKFEDLRHHQAGVGSERWSTALRWSEIFMGLWVPAGRGTSTSVPWELEVAFSWEACLRFFLLSCTYGASVWRPA